MNSEATNLYFIRHAEVEERYHRVFGGRLDMPLSRQGHRQADAMAGYLRRRRFDGLYASPMLRVQQTLKPLNGPDQLQPVTLSEFREVDFGSWTGLTWDEVRERHQMSPYDWLEYLESGRIREAEPLTEFTERVGNGLQRVLKAHSGETVAIACHGGVIRMALAILLELPLSKMKAFDIEYASVTWVSCHPEKTEVQLLNFAPWRDL